MGNCLPVCVKRNKVAPLPLQQVYASKSARTVPRYALGTSKKANSQCTVKSYKTAAEQKVVLCDLKSKLSNNSLLSAAESTESVLVRCCGLNFECENLRNDGPHIPSPSERETPLCPHDSITPVSVDTPIETLESKQQTIVLEQAGTEQPKISNTEQQTEPQDDETKDKPTQNQRPPSSHTYIVQYEDSYLRNKAREMSLKRAAQKVASARNENKPDSTADAGKSELVCGAATLTKPERSVSVYFEQSNEEFHWEEPEGASEGFPSKKERPTHDYTARLPKFTDPLILCDVDEDDFKTLFADEDDEVGDDDTDANSLSGDLGEIIDYILTDKPPLKEKNCKGDGNTSVDNKDDIDFIFSDRPFRSETDRYDKYSIEKIKHIAKLRKQRHSMRMSEATSALCGPGAETNANVDLAESKAKVSDAESNELIGRPNTPTSNRPRLPKTKPVLGGGTLPSVMACGCTARAVHRTVVGRTGRNGPADNSSVSRGRRELVPTNTDHLSEPTHNTTSPRYDAAELHLMQQIEQHY